MKRSLARLMVVVVIACLAGIAMTAGAFALMPDVGSSPSIYDDFNWSSTSNGYWHVDEAGATARIKHSMLTLSGDEIELDRRVQTDPYETDVSMRVRGLQLHKFGFGLGVWHAGTLGMEFDDDAMRCGRGSNYGYQVDVMKSFATPPVGQWYYLEVRIINPYPDPTKVPKNADDLTLKKVRLICAVYDARGKRLAADDALHPPPNTHYVGLDEAYIRTWDSANKYQVDWFYAGPPSGDPLRAIVPASQRA